MFYSISAFLAIIGTVIGSGFISGKEVVVFFSRFGLWSFPCIILTFFLFFFIFKFLLFKGEKSLKKIEKSKFSFVLNLILCSIFSASMFAGSINMVKGLGKIAVGIFIILLLFLSARVSKRGISSLNKLNFLLVPIMTLVLIFGGVYLLFKGGSVCNVGQSFGELSILYTFLYVVLNTANGCVLIANFGQKLTDKQKTRVAFWSALVLCVILLIINIVLLFSPKVFGEEMPLLALFSGVWKQVLSFAILIGCVTTLFSLIYSLSSSMRGLCKNEIWIFCVSVIMPFVLSLCGFGFIVSYLYPLASVIGAILLAQLSFIPLFKRADKKVHSASKDAK